ncbi:hypothetical protein [Streptomyces sp. NPDC048650]|uniref:hypothetical protein n=1 Tax=unclassified Streptomyces TaxID=2593676 RepID=UPI003712EB0D
MAVSWAKRIVIAEPAPKPARFARYLAPHWKGLMCLESENGVGVIPTIAFFILIASVVFGAGGAGFAGLIEAVWGCHCLARSWVGFDIGVGFILSISYWFVGRYGLRFYEADPAANPLWRLVSVGNTAWRSLPGPHRESQVPRLRALNAAARILLTDPEDVHTLAALTAHTQVLRRLSTTVLGDIGSGPPESASPALPAAPAPSGTPPGIRISTAPATGCGTRFPSVLLQRTTPPDSPD